jgi:cobyrinic acid a,c-diamide synthase
MTTGRHEFLISAAHKSSGKTTVSIGIAAALSRRGLTVQPYKKGPDYIDPLWLSQASGRACRNLDLHLSDEATCRRAFVRHANDADVALIEGNKGLYDGLAVDGSNSNAALAKLLELPVVLVIDCRGMIRGIAPLVLGYQAFDPQVRIAGVILNRVGGARHEAKLREVMQRYTTVPVLGAIPETPELALAERHLGLMPSNEDPEAGDKIATLARIVARAVDLDALLAATVAARAPANATVVPLPLRGETTRRAVSPAHRPAAAAAPTIGIVRDRAFGFYYPDDLDALCAAGATLQFIDSLRDSHLPAIDALFIGGGFPETLAASLEANAGLRAEIRAAIAGGLPAYAECGGLMYLSRSIEWQGRRYEMVGAIAADTVMHAKPVGRGYVEVEASAAHPWWPAGTRLRGHEFHYSALRALDPQPAWAWMMRRGHGVDGTHDGLLTGNLLAAYTHLRSTGSDNDWATAFVAFVRRRTGAQVAQPGTQRT